MTRKIIMLGKNRCPYSKALEMGIVALEVIREGHADTLDLARAFNVHESDVMVAMEVARSAERRRAA